MALKNINAEKIQGTFDTLTVSGLTSIEGTLYASIISGGTLYSGSTELSTIFALAGTDTNSYTTGFTYDNANAFTVSVSDGNDYTAVIDEMTGLTIGGDLTVNGQSVFSGETDVVTIYGSGTTSPIFSINGSSGQLFSVNDSLIGDIFSVNDISGFPILTVNSEEVVTVDGALVMNTETTSGLTVGSTTCATIDATLGRGAYFDYYLMSGETMRAGTVMTVWNSSSVEYTDTSTKDLGGDTSVVAFSATTSGGFTNLIAVVDSGTWVVKTGTRII